MEHTTAIARMYMDIVEAFNEASEELKDKPITSYKQLLGWSDHCKSAHGAARNSYLMWRDIGKPRQGYAFQEMKSTRAYFKYIIRKCKHDSDKRSADIVTKQLVYQDEKSFWK